MSWLNLSSIGGVHPHNKTEVGRRLGLAVRNIVYGDRRLSYRSPTLESVGFNGKSLTITFGNTTSIAWGPTHNCTACCAPGQMVIQASSVATFDPHFNIQVAPTGSGPELTGTIPGPTRNASYFRYAWSNYPECVLFGNGSRPLSAGPFSVKI